MDEREDLCAAGEVEVRAVTASESQRIWWAIALSPNVEVCASLLRGEPVEAESLDPLALEGAKQHRAVLLRPITDLFQIRETA